MLRRVGIDDADMEGNPGNIFKITINNTMENQVEKFDPSKLMDGVKDRIKTTFVSLIPDSQWETMCDAEMKKFFEPTWTGWDKKDRNPSEFEKIVTELMKEQCRKYLKELLAKPEYSIEQTWTSPSFSVDGSGGAMKTTLSDHLDAMIKEKMPEMMQAMFSSVMADAFYQFFNNAQTKVRGQIVQTY